MRAVIPESEAAGGRDGDVSFEVSDLRLSDSPQPANEMGTMRARKIKR
jgi:hypothetical protein